MSVQKWLEYIFKCSISCWSIYKGAGMAQCWEPSPSTAVARVRFLDPASLLLVLLLFRVLWFSSLHKNQHFLILIRSGNSGWRATSWKCLCKFHYPYRANEHTGRPCMWNRWEGRIHLQRNCGGEVGLGFFSVCFEWNEHHIARLISWVDTTDLFMSYCSGLYISL